MLLFTRLAPSRHKTVALLGLLILALVACVSAPVSAPPTSALPAATGSGLWDAVRTVEAQPTLAPAAPTRQAVTPVMRTTNTSQPPATRKVAATRRVSATPRATATPHDGLSTVREQALPREAQTTLRLIRKGGPFPYAKDGAVFQNREGLLPKNPRGYYREYTVITPGEGDRGARRIVAGQNGELYYTDDHYDSFKRVTP